MLANSLKQLFPNLDFRTECILQDDGNGPYIKQWNRAEPIPTVAEILAANLPAAKNDRIAAINADCRARVIARFGVAEEQISRAIGIYGAAEKTAMETGIAATIDASNIAGNAVLAATTMPDVEAVTVAWPII